MPLHAILKFIVEKQKPGGRKELVSAFDVVKISKEQFETDVAHGRCVINIFKCCMRNFVQKL
jgi:hypothetical protein